MPIRELVVRRQQASTRDANLGYEAEVPGFDLPKEPPGDRAVPESWTSPLPHGARVDRIRPEGFVEPSAWERAWLAWLAKETGAPLVEGWDDAADPAPASTTLSGQLCRTEPWTSLDDIPDHVLVRRAASRRGEARAAARQIRTWLRPKLGTPEATAACTRVLVLLPDDPVRMALWARELRRLDLPCSTLTVRPVSDSAFADFVLALAELSGWSNSKDGARTRSVLRRVLESPFFSMSQVIRSVLDLESVPEGLPSSLRKFIARSLRSLRRPSVTLDQWVTHVDTMELQKWDDPRATQFLQAFCQRLAKQLDDGPDRFLRLRALVVPGGGQKSAVSIGVRGAARELDKEGPLANLVELAGRALLGLEYEESAHGGRHPQLTDSGDERTEALALVRQALAGAVSVESVESEEGIALVPYRLYDGRKADRLILAGLGEGEFPVAPAGMTEDEVAWLERLGLVHDRRGDESLDSAFVRQSMERQIRLARAAIERADHVTLSFAMQGAGTHVTHPGALLSLLVGRWEKPQDWEDAAGKRQDVSWGHEWPHTLEACGGWAEAALFADSPELVGAAEDLALDTEADRQRIHDFRATHLALQTSNTARDARQPMVENAPLGPYTGRLPGPGLAPTAFSASALEQYGQCGYKYFLSRVLKAKKIADDGTDPAHNEMGTLVHDAYTRVTRDQVDLAADKLWDLCYPEGDEDAKRSVTDDAKKRLIAALREALADEYADHPTYSKALLDRIGDRWAQALSEWVDKHIQPYPTFDLTDASISEASGVRKAQASVDKLAGAEAFAVDQRAKTEAGELTKQKAGKDARQVGLVGTRFKEAFDVFKADGSLAAFDEQIDNAKEMYEAAKAALHAAMEAERARRRGALVRRVVHGELSFGYSSEELDAEEQKGNHHDPHSPRGPLTLKATGIDVPVRGQIDRVDWDPDRQRYSVRDYKSGKGLDAPELKRHLVNGRQVQLPLYAMAVDALVKAGHLAHLDGASPGVMAQDLPKHVKTTEIRIEEETGFSLEPSDPAGNPATWMQISEQWIGHHASGIREGRYDLQPTACPLRKDSEAYCDFSRVCRFSPTHDALFARDDTQPSVVPIPPPDPSPAASNGNEKDPPVVRVMPPESTVETPSEEEGEDLLGAASKTVQNLESHVAISAGAGSGKTYNLVVRYLKALVGEQGGSPPVDPGQILCVTFTRRAAAEMAHRVRQALLSDEGGPQGELVAALRADEARFRSILLSLSAAPISTLDSLAARILRELEASRAPESRRALPEVVASGTLASDAAAFVRRRFVETLDAGGQTAADLETLLDAITVHKLRDLITAAVTDGGGIDIAAEKIEKHWWALCAHLTERMVEVVRSVPLDEFEQLIQETRDAHEGKTTKKANQILTYMDTCDDRLDAARELTDGGLDPIELWERFARLKSMSSNKDNLGPDLHPWVVEHIKNITHRVAPGSSDDATLMSALITLSKDPDRLTTLADLAARAQKVIRLWSREFEQHLEMRGVARHSDVEAEAIRALEVKENHPVLRARLPFAHIFVDESQDTSENQIRLIDRLAGLTGATVFWVGDVKQSIFRFRGAEVDVFEGLVTRPDVAPAVLRINFRSEKPLVRSVNRLFGNLLPAMRDGVCQDLGSAMDYQTLTWPKKRKNAPDDPQIELIATPNASWNLSGLEETEVVPDDDDDDDDDGDRTPRDTIAPTVAEGAVVMRILDLLDSEQQDTSARIAVLVHSWTRAERYRDLLVRYGVQASVQGGRGLLATPEVDQLILWLELAARNDTTALIGSLRGPGIAMSDVGLYCLRMGYGVDPTESSGPSQSVASSVFRAFDPDRAVAAWKEVAPELDADGALAVLRADADALSRFQVCRERFAKGVKSGRVTESLERLVEDLDLAAYWYGVRGGRQAVANITSFLDLVAEGASGRSAGQLLEWMEGIRNSEDPASGGLDAGSGAQVILTTYWQAKGREWPIVVLPDIERTTASADGKGLAAERLVVPDSGVFRVPEFEDTKPKSPFKTEKSEVRALVDRWRRPAGRAELRRLLYVAMTRPKSLLVLAGTFHKPNPKKCIPAEDDEKHFTVALANDWASTLLACLDLQFDDDGTPRLGTTNDVPRGVWSSDDVLLRASKPLADRLPKMSRNATPGPERVLTIDDAKRWTPVVSPPIVRTSPSKAHERDVPQPLQGLGGLPEEEVKKEGPFPTVALEGDAFHGLMERWAFKQADPTPQEAIEVLEQLKLYPHPLGQERVDYLLQFVKKTRAEQAALCERLAAAAERGDLYHELPVRFRDADHRLVEGSIDVVWKESDGWHLLDYKTGYAAPIQDQGLKSTNLRKYYAQVRLYADGMQRTLGDEPIVDFGLWYVWYGLVLQWPT